jgi:methylmalonyl-CoA/ethylmalonyl-CoA epimerase
MPSGPLAHVCFLVKDLDQATEDWSNILRALAPAPHEAKIVRYDRFEAGGDVMSWANFVNPDGCEIQLLCPLNEDGPLGRRLAKRGEGVHHICFTTPDLPGSVEKLVEAGVDLTSTELSQDPQVPWQHWTFVAPTTSHGLLVEVAYPYEAVDGKWEPGEGVPVP